MKRIFQVTFSLVIIVAFTFCTNQEPSPGFEPELISIDVDDKTRDHLKVDIVKVIPLETSEQCLIGFTGKVKIYNDRIYFLNNLRFKQPDLFVFDIEGNFINKTIHGRGPGEVIEPFAFAINSEDNTVLMHDQATGYNHIFDLELNFIRTLKHDRVLIMDLLHVEKDTYLVYNFSVNRDYKGQGYEYVNYHIYSDDFNNHKPLKIKLYGDKVPTTMTSPFSIWENEILFAAPYNYNIYQLLGDSIQIRYTLDFGKHGFSQDELRDLAFMEMRAQVMEGKKIGSIPGFLRTRDFMVFTTYWNQKPLIFMKSLKKDKIYCLNDSVDEELMSLFSIRGVMDDGTFYSVMEASSLMEKQDLHEKLRISQIDENDNPYLILFKIHK